jgi:hypothetical protein
MELIFASIVHLLQGFAGKPRRRHGDHALKGKERQEGEQDRAGSANFEAPAR